MGMYLDLNSVKWFVTIQCLSANVSYGHQFVYTYLYAYIGFSVGFDNFFDDIRNE